MLKEAGADGAYQDYIIEQLSVRGVKTWDELRIAKGSLASTCGHDPAFVRIGVGTFALRAVTHHPEVTLDPDQPIFSLQSKYDYLIKFIFLPLPISDSLPDQMALLSLLIL